ncbi:normocyte binding protein 1 [Plasmodium sp. DRC-Itaito]|nr:normocyte binding protein 1 [Plasmodium sp. DRC-Itaito]
MQKWIFCNIILYILIVLTELSCEKENYDAKNKIKKDNSGDYNYEDNPSYGENENYIKNYKDDKFNDDSFKDGNIFLHLGNSSNSKKNIKRYSKDQKERKENVLIPIDEEKRRLNNYFNKGINFLHTKKGKNNSYKFDVDKNASFLNNRDYKDLVLMQYDYTYLEAVKDILHFIPKDKEYHKYFKEKLQKNVSNFKDSLKLLREGYIQNKLEMIRIHSDIEILNDFYKKDIVNDNYFKKEMKNKNEEMEKYKREYNSYISKYEKEFKKKIQDLSNEISINLNKSTCEKSCYMYLLRLEEYKNKIKHEINKINKLPEMYINDKNFVYSFLKNVINDKIDIYKTISSLISSEKQIFYVEYIYRMNKSILNLLSRDIKKIDINNDSKYTYTKSHFLRDNNILLSKYYTLKFLNILNETYYITLYKNKINLFNKYVIDVINNLKEYSYKYIRSIQNKINTHKQQMNLQDIIKYANNIYSQHNTSINEISKYDNLLINTNIQELQQKVLQIEQNKKDIKHKVELIDDIYKKVYNELLKKENEELKKIYVINNNIKDNKKKNIQDFLTFIQQIKQFNILTDQNIKQCHNYYDEIKKMKEDINNIHLYIQPIINHLHTLKEIQNNKIKYEQTIKNILQKIFDKIENLKKIILLKDQAQLNITILDDLINKKKNYNQIIHPQEEKIKNTSNNFLQIYIQQKNIETKNIQQVLKSLYDGDINTFIQKISKYILEQKEIELTQQYLYTNHKINEYLQQIQNEQDKINNTIKDIKIQEALKQMTDILNNINIIKKNIVKEFINNLIKNMYQQYDDIQQGYNNITNYINQYEQQNNNIKQYIHHLHNIQTIYYDNKYAKEKDTHSRDYYIHFVESKNNVDNIKKNLNKYLHIIKKEQIKNIQNSLDQYDYIKKYIHILTSEENTQSDIQIYNKLITQLDSIKQNIETYNTQHNFIDYEQKKNTYDDIHQQLIEEFINLYKRIKVLKILNISLKACEKNNQSINLLNEKTEELKKNVIHEITVLQKKNDISTNNISDKNNILSLNDLLKEIDQSVIDINKLLNEESNELLNYFEQSKINFYNKNKKENFDIQNTINKMNEWLAIKKKINEINKNYQTLYEKKINILLNNSKNYVQYLYDQIINLIFQKKNDLNNILKTQIEEKDHILNSLLQNEEYQKVKNQKDQIDIKNIKQLIEQTKNDILTYENQIKQIEEKNLDLKKSAESKDEIVNTLNDVKKNIIYTYEKIDNQLLNVLKNYEEGKGEFDKNILQMVNGMDDTKDDDDIKDDIYNLDYINDDNINDDDDDDIILSNNINIELRHINFREINKNILQIFRQFKSVNKEIKKQSNQINKEFIGIDQITKELNDIHTQMNILYKELNEKSSEFNKKKIEDINHITENINNIEMWYEKNIIEYFLRHINEQNNKAKKDIDTIENYKNNIETISKKINPQKYLETLNKLNMYLYIDKAKNLFYNLINNIVINSNELKNQAFTLNLLQIIQTNRKNLLTNKQQIIQYTNDIHNILKEMENINKILVLTNYKSIIQDIVINVNHVDTYKENLHQLYIKSEKQKEQIQNIHNNSKIIYNKINLNEDSFIKNLLNDIEKIKNEITHIKDQTNIHLSDVEKYKNEAQLYFHNTQRAEEKIEYLKSHNNSTNEKITLEELEQIKKNANKVKEIYNQTINYEHKIKNNYDIILNDYDQINKILHDSFIKQINIESENKKKQTKEIIDIINDKTFEQHINTYKTNINNLKKQSDFKDIDKKLLLNEEALKLFVDINTTTNNLENMLTEIDSIQKNINTYIKEANESFHKFNNIYNTNIKDLLNKLILEDVNYINNLKSVENQMVYMNVEKNFMLDKSKKIDEEEKKLDILKNNISKINDSLDKLKKYYEEALFQKLKEKADTQKEYIEKIRKEINTLTDTFKTSLFIELNEDLLSTHNKNLTNNVETYKHKMDIIYNLFMQSYNIIQKYSSQIISPALNYLQTKEIKDKSLKEENQLNQNEKDALELLKSFKTNQTIKLFIQIKNETNGMVHDIEEDHKLIQEYFNNIKNKMDQLKKYKNNIDSNNMNGDKDILLKETISYYDKINKIYNNSSTYKIKEDTYYNNILKAAAILNIKIKKQQKEETNFIDVEYNSSLINKEEEIQKQINNQINELNQLHVNIFNISKDIENIKKQSEEIITHMNDIYKSTILLIDIIKKKEEALNKENIISSNINYILNKKENIIDKVIKCNLENYKDILIQNETKYEELKNINHTYEEKKKQILLLDISKIKDIKHNNIEEYKKKLKQINLTINESIEKNVLIKTDILQNEIIILEQMIKNLDILDEQIIKYINNIDELYKLGKTCDNHLITTISVVVNRNTSKIMLHMNKQKEEINKINNYIQSNYNTINNEFQYFKELYGNNNILSQKDQINFINILQEQKNEYTQKEKEISKIIKQVKKGLYSLNENNMDNKIHINIIDQNVNQNILEPYNKLITSIKHIDNVFIKIYKNKFEQIQKYIQIIKPLEILNNNINTDNLKQLNENQKKLQSIETQMKQKEQILIKKMNDIEKDNITDEYINNIHQNILKPITLNMNEYKTFINHNMDHLNNTPTKLFSDHHYFKKQQEYISNVIQTINKFINDLDNNQHEYYYYYEWNEEYKQIDQDKMNKYINNIKNNLYDSKKQLEQNLQSVKNNENIIDFIQLKTKDIDDVIKNINNVKETYLNELNKKQTLQNKQMAQQKIKSNQEETIKHDNKKVEKEHQIRDVKITKDNIITKPNNNLSERSNQNEHKEKKIQNTPEIQTRNIKPHHIPNNQQKDISKSHEQNITAQKINNTAIEPQNKDNQQSKKEKTNSGSNERMYFASGLIVSILFLSSVGFVINSKNNKDEYDKNQEEQQQSHFACANSEMQNDSSQKYGKNEEEVMEVSFDNDYI